MCTAENDLEYFLSLLLIERKYRNEKCTRRNSQFVHVDLDSPGLLCLGQRDIGQERSLFHQPMYTVF